MRHVGPQRLRKISEAKDAKVGTNGMKPQAANPAAIDIIFCSAIPVLINLSGKISRKAIVPFE
jgi:hypothetical protein